MGSVAGVMGGCCGTEITSWVGGNTGETRVLLGRRARGRILGGGEHCS